MAIPARHLRVPGTYFVTSRTWESRALFTKARICEIFVQSLLHYRDEGAYQLHGFVLMSDHFHILLTPGGGMTLERAVQFIKGGSAHRIRKELSFRFPVWQRGFSDHRIRNPQDYAIHTRYIEQNPVKKKLVSTPEAYPWCSASGKLAMDEPPQRLKPFKLVATVSTAKAVP